MQHKRIKRIIGNVEWLVKYYIHLIIVITKSTLTRDNYIWYEDTEVDKPKGFLVSISVNSTKFELGITIAGKKSIQLVVYKTNHIKKSK